MDDVSMRSSRGHKLSASIKDEDVGSHGQKQSFKQILKIPKVSNFIEDWLSKSSWSRSSNAMPPKMSEKSFKLPNRSKPPNDDSSQQLSTLPTTSSRPRAGVADANYRVLLESYNIFIEKEEAPAKLMSQAIDIVTRPRTPQITNAMVKKLKRQIYLNQTGTEDEIKTSIVAPMFPSILQKTNEDRIAVNQNKRWIDCVPVPLRLPSILRPSLPLPQPDVCIGWNGCVFDSSQEASCLLLTDGEFGSSYCAPAGKTHFPFLVFEFKSQATGGTQYVATNQTAGAGAVALNGILELVKRGGQAKTFDYEKPLFFSLTMDYEVVRINVHWVKALTIGGKGKKEDQRYSFHVATVKKYFLVDDNNIQVVNQAVSNIVDYGANKLLPMIRSLLDAYTAARANDDGH